jgi:metal-responsive CopG/Arc/MetJ family transcriptional regulator
MKFIRLQLDARLIRMLDDIAKRNGTGRNRMIERYLTDCANQYELLMYEVQVKMGIESYADE